MKSSTRFGVRIILVAITGTTFCNISTYNSPRITHSDDIPIISNNSNGFPYLSKNFVADAVDISSPSVVNIKSKSGLSIAVGSGFIISSVCVHI